MGPTSYVQPPPTVTTTMAVPITTTEANTLVITLTNVKAPNVHTSWCSAWAFRLVRKENCYSDTSHERQMMRAKIEVRTKEKLQGRRIVTACGLAYWLGERKHVKRGHPLTTFSRFFMVLLFVLLLLTSFYYSLNNQHAISLTLKC